MSDEAFVAGHLQSLVPRARCRAVADPAGPSAVGAEFSGGVRLAA